MTLGIPTKNASGPGPFGRLGRWLGRRPSAKDTLQATIERCRAEGVEGVEAFLTRPLPGGEAPADHLRRAANLALSQGDGEIAVRIAPLALAHDASKAMLRWLVLVESRAGLLVRPAERLQQGGVRIVDETPNAAELRALLGFARLRERPPQVSTAAAAPLGDSVLFVHGEAPSWGEPLVGQMAVDVRHLVLQGWTIDVTEADGEAGAPDCYLAAAQASVMHVLAAAPAGCVVVDGDLWLSLPALLAARARGAGFVQLAAALPPPPAAPLDERGRLLHSLRALVAREADAMVAADEAARASLELAGAPLDRIVMRGDEAPRGVSRLLRRHAARPGSPADDAFVDVVLDMNDEAPTAWRPLDMNRGQTVVLRAAFEGGKRLRLRADVMAAGPERPRALIADVRYFGEDNTPLPTPYPDCASSERHPAYFYVAAGQGALQRFGKTLTVPETAQRLELCLRSFDRGPAPRLVQRPRIEPREVEPAAWLPLGLEADRPLTRSVRASAGDRMLLSLLLEATEPSLKAAVAQIVFLDRRGRALTAQVAVLASSSRYPHYVYVEAASRDSGTWIHVGFEAPAGTARVEMRLHSLQGGAGLVVAGRPALRPIRLVDLPDLRARYAPHAGWLSQAVAVAQADGALRAMESLLRDWVREAGGAPEVVRRWKAVCAELQELEPDWIPRLGVRRALPRRERLTICHLHKTAYPFENTGGAIRCLNTLTSQRALGLDPYVITPPGYPASDGVDDADVHAQVAGIDHFRIGPATAGVRTLSPPMRTQFAAVQAAVIVARRGASLIHAASGVRGYELALQALAMREVFDLPVIYEVRSFHEHTWAPADPRIFDLERTQMRIAKENRCMAMADHVVTISESMRRILIERGVPEHKIDVVPNAIDEQAFQNEPEPVVIPALQGAELVVGYVSNMSRREGHAHLLDAVALLRAGGMDVRCLFVGQGPERDALEQQAQHLGIAPMTVFAGEVDHQAVQAYYRAIDIFVVPRVPDYAADWVTPLKPFEAMALGRPLVVTDLPALREVVGDGDRGRIARPADPGSLAQEILALARDVELRDAQVARARQWVFAHRTWAANAKRYEEIYRRVIARHDADRQGGGH